MTSCTTTMVWFARFVLYCPLAHLPNPAVRRIFLMSGFGSIFSLSDEVQSAFSGNVHTAI